MQNSYNQIVYGSLLHPKELKKHSINMDMVEFVKVKNFKRVFNQEPSIRKVDSINRAVLNIEADSLSWFNALLIKNISENSLKELNEREIGYDRLNLEDGYVRYYSNDKIVKNCFIYIGKNGKQNSTIFPNPKYFKLCLNGAKSHFEEFYQDYISTTYQNNQGKLRLISNF
ncbi:MAG: gamma-glutamylcyclotransferase family protein [Sulfurospirillum sp.]